jgi:hypothetical protein
MNVWQKQQVDGNDCVPNAYVNNDGKANVNDSNVQNDNAARLLMRENGCYARTLLSHPPSIRLASANLAWSLRQFVSLASFSSKIVRICRVSNSA